jgi:hypothetical protein
MFSQADIYRAAMRLIEEHGDAAEVAAILRAEPLPMRDDSARALVLKAIEQLRVAAAKPPT